jgi:hypothetical protein
MFPVVVDFQAMLRGLLPNDENRLDRCAAGSDQILTSWSENNFSSSERTGFCGLAPEGRNIYRFVLAEYLLSPRGAAYSR